jgi:acetoin utilization deacetylase AcuC-like enzyme
VKTGIITTDTYLNHNTGQGHPENADRVSVIIENLKKIRNKNFVWKKPKKFDSKYLKNTHNSNYVSEVEKSFPKKGLFFLDGDTVVSPGSKEASSDAVGSIITAIDGVQNKEFQNAFCAVRPPGHHAQKNKAMGFCIYNNVAVGAHYLLEKYKLNKIAIIDFDVHHGNGTQDIFYNNEKVLYISTHQYPYYPGTGGNNEKGKHNNVLNIPLPAGTTSEEYLNAYEHVLKKLKQFNPEFILFSAGFDAHKDDPLAQLQLTSKDFYHLTKRTLNLSKLYCEGKVVSILEGGYDLNALKESTKMHVDALLEFSK